MNTGIREICNIAKNNVPFYMANRSLYENIYDFPIISRRHLSEERDSFISTKYTAYDLKYMKCLRTSGTSTGYPLEIYWSYEDYIHSSYLTWEYRKKWYGILPLHRYVCFHTYSYANNRAKPLEKYIIHKNYLSLNACDLSDDNLKEYCELILNYKPKWIQFIPNIALKLVEYMKRNLISPFPSVEYIEYNGETLHDWVRAEVDSFFKVKSANLYGCMELNTIAFECPHGCLQLISDNVYTEFIDNRIYVTSMLNKVMPLIRYDLGDEVEVVNNRCDCTNNKLIISKISGRLNSSILIRDKVVTEGLVGYCIDLINNYLCDCIRQFCFEKKDDEYVLLLYIFQKFNGWKTNIAKKVIEVFKENNIEFCEKNIVFTNQPINNEDKKFRIFR